MNPHADSIACNKRLSEILVLIKSTGYCLNKIQ